MRPPLPQELIDQIVALYQQGKQITDIAKIVGVSRGSCYEKLKKLGLYQEARVVQRTCPFCGGIFETKINSRKIYCSERCKDADKQKKWRERQKNGLAAMVQAAEQKKKRKQYPHPLIRPYTSTSDMLIAGCLLEGYKIPEIAKLLGRDEQDLEEHIQEAQNSLERWARWLINRWGVDYFEKKRLRKSADEGRHN